MPVGSMGKNGQSAPLQAFAGPRVGSTPPKCDANFSNGPKLLGNGWSEHVIASIAASPLSNELDVARARSRQC